MGWGSFFAGLAADAAKDYVNKRGLDGMLEDAGNLKNKVTGMFSGNDDVDYDDYSQDNSEDFWGTLDSYIEEQDFHGAEVYVNNNAGQGVKDDFYFYAMAYVYNLKAVAFDSIEDERKAKSYISNAVNMLNGDSDWRKSVYDLRKQIDDNLNIFRKEKKDTDQAMKEWENVVSLFELDSECSGADAITALEEYYTRRNEERDIFYHMYIYRGYEKLILKEDEDPACFYEDMKLKVAMVSDLARSNPKDYGETAKELRESFLFWENIHYETEVDELINSGNLTKAKDIAQKLMNDSALYTRVMTRIESLQLLEMVTNRKPSESEVKRKIFAVEDVMRRACQLEEDKETSGKIRAAAEERINTAKQYLEGKLPTQKPNASSKATAVAEGEAEYLEELKVCYEDGVITDKERRLLDRLRKSLGISEARAAELEAMCQPQSLTAEEWEYANEVKACLEDDGEIIVKERRLFDRLAKSLNISPDRASEIERMI
ncbi:MAG: hypothetical protein K2K98_02345 [Muribaculaceae bacterium]|nr:hypothetical protein [Muribaculaceae bacterium]